MKIIIIINDLIIIRIIIKSHMKSNSSNQMKYFILSIALLKVLYVWKINFDSEIIEGNERRE